MESLRSRAWELDTSVLEVKRHALRAALGETWYTEVLATWIHRAGTPAERLAHRAMAVAERALDAEAPAAAGAPLEAAPPTLQPALDLEAEAGPDLAPLLAALSPAERAFAEHLLAQPSLTDAERDRELGRGSGYTKVMRGRLRRRLTG
jgi:hypothetical protein